MSTVTKTTDRLTLFKKQVENALIGKRDEFIDLAALRMQENGLYQTLGGELKDYRMTEWATQQLCNKIPFKYGYYQDCPSDLARHNINYWLERTESKNILLRLRETEGDRFIRGLVSDRYTKFDNHELLGLVDGYLQRANQPFGVEMARHDGDGMHLRLTFDALTTSIGQTPDGRPDVHKVGIHIRNSEVGNGSVAIFPMVYRLVCSNGLMAWRADGDNLFSQRHFYIDADTMEERVAVAIGEALQMGDRTVDILKQAKQKKVDDPFEIIDKLSKDRKYTKKFTEEVKTHYNAENDGKDRSLFYVVQAFTRASRDLQDDMRLEVERDASKLLSLIDSVA